jgi:hypothetical protein
MASAPASFAAAHASADGDVAAVAAAYAELRRHLDVGFDIALAPGSDGVALLETRFGQLVWLCRALEAAHERYTGAPPPPFEYDLMDAARNLGR